MKQPDSEPNLCSKRVIASSAAATLGAVLVTGAGAVEFAGHELRNINYSDVNPSSLDGPGPKPAMRLGEMSQPTNIPLSPVFLKLQLPTEK